MQLHATSRCLRVPHASLTPFLSRYVCTEISKLQGNHTSLQRSETDTWLTLRNWRHNYGISEAGRGRCGPEELVRTLSGSHLPSPAPDPTASRDGSFNNRHRPGTPGKYFSSSYEYHPRTILVRMICCLISTACPMIERTVLNWPLAGPQTRHSFTHHFQAIGSW